MSHGTWLHRLVRPAVRPLVRLGITPNQLTSVRLVTGLAAAVALAEGSPFLRDLGGLFFLVSMLFDRADGELARQSGQSTEWGHRYDLVVDTLCNALAFAALGIGLGGGAFGAAAPVLGCGAGLAIAAILLMVMRVEARAGARAAELKGAGGFDPDDALLIVPLAIWLGGAEVLLGAAGVGAPAFALFFGLHHRALLGAGR